MLFTDSVVTAGVPAYTRDPLCELSESLVIISVIPADASSYIIQGTDGSISA